MSNETPLEVVAARVAGKLPKPQPAVLRGINGTLKPQPGPVKPVTQPATGGVRG